MIQFFTFIKDYISEIIALATLIAFVHTYNNIRRKAESEDTDT